MTEDQMIKSFFLSRPKTKFSFRRSILVARVLHLFWCPEKCLTEPGKVRVCRKCGRMKVMDPKLRSVFRAHMRTGQGTEKVGLMGSHPPSHGASSVRESTS